MRGEHRPREIAVYQQAGSSPHARGAQCFEPVEGVGLGLIPACAGSTSPPPAPRPTPRAHPRMRGEHSRTDEWLARHRGSSPHARGAPRPRRRQRRQRGLIPACAGSTGRNPPPRCVGGAHPRMRGEHHRQLGHPIHGTGSSPHARGALELLVELALCGGLIPACAGSTPIGRRTVVARRAHPRMRGEHLSGSGKERKRRGSSPHARGALAAVPGKVAARGLIPACAGTTGPVLLGFGHVRAHPRMRGDHFTLLNPLLLATGSSPHARGPRPGTLRPPHQRGLIPACAGTTPSWPRCCRAGWAHPRMRGDHRRRASLSRTVRGSSPHARGPPTAIAMCHSWKGLIPACAGTTLIDLQVLDG